MLPDFGWSELLMIGIVLIVVIGPKDALRMVKSASKGLKTARKMSDDFRKQFSDAIDEADLAEMRELANDVKGLDPRRQIKDALAPLSKVGADLSDDFKSAVDEVEAESIHPMPEFKPALPKTPSAAEEALAASGNKMKAAQPSAKAKAKAEPATEAKVAAEPDVEATATAKPKPSRKPAAKKPATKKPVAAKAKATKEVGDAAPAKKPAARKPAAKKAAAAQKPAVTKTAAAKKPAAKPSTTDDAMPAGDAT